MLEGAHQRTGVGVPARHNPVQHILARQRIDTVHQRQCRKAPVDALHPQMLGHVVCGRSVVGDRSVDGQASSSRFCAAVSSGLGTMQTCRAKHAPCRALGRTRRVGRRAASSLTRRKPLRARPRDVRRQKASEIKSRVAVEPIESGVDWHRSAAPYECARRDPEKDNAPQIDRSLLQTRQTRRRRADDQWQICLPRMVLHLTGLQMPCLSSVSCGQDGMHLFSWLHDDEPPWGLPRSAEDRGAQRTHLHELGSHLGLTGLQTPCSRTVSCGQDGMHLFSWLHDEEPPRGLARSERKQGTADALARVGVALGDGLADAVLEVRLVRARRDALALVVARRRAAVRPEQVRGEQKAV